MNTAAEILLFIVSGVLSIFLIVAIVLVLRLISVVQSLKRIVYKAEKVADSAESVGEFFKKSVNKIAIGRLIANIVDHVVKNKGPKED